MKSLEGKTSGIYKVYTETSSYVINLNRNVAKRVPGDGLGKDPSTFLEAEVKELKGDNLWFSLRGIHAVVGQIMHLDCQGIHDEDVYTWRRTTIVRKIEILDGREEI
jgi:hypothetical protein